jgi:cysteine desulfurase
MREVYLDNAASTPVDEQVLSAMLPYFRENYGNPSSLHKKGIEAERGIKRAREQIAKAVGADAAQVYFTSGGTEGNAIGLLGAAGKGAVVISHFEHPSVTASAKLRGEVRVVAPTPEAFVKASGGAAVASCMLVSNEIGTIQPIAEIARALRAAGWRGHFHVDAVQALGKIPLRLADLGVDSIALSSHKLHGPKGTGAVVVRAGVRLSAIWGGGKHEGGLRPGTENAPGIVGFGEAAELATRDLAASSARMAELRDRLAAGIVAAGIDARDATAAMPRAPHIAALVFARVMPEVLLHALEKRGVYVSAGSACSSRDKHPSAAAVALGLRDDEGMVRLSLSRMTADEDIDAAIAAIPEAVREARL